MTSFDPLYVPAAGAIPHPQLRPRPHRSAVATDGRQLRDVNVVERIAIVDVHRHRIPTDGELIGLRSVVRGGAPEFSRRDPPSTKRRAHCTGSRRLANRKRRGLRHNGPRLVERRDHPAL